MRCPHDNRPGAKLYEECAAPLGEELRRFTRPT